MGKMKVTALMLLAGTTFLGGCATKGSLRTAVDEQRAATAEQRAALDVERSERIAADERLGRDLAQLRTDMNAMRDDFGAQIAAVANGLQFVLPVHFGFDDATVRQADMAALARFAEVVSKHYPGSVVTVEGFADPSGSRAYNQALSARRAESVRSHLMERGIQAQVNAVGMNTSRLVVPNAGGDAPGAELNRRVVFVIESPPSSATVTLLDG